MKGPEGKRCLISTTSDKFYIGIVEEFSVTDGVARLLDARRILYVPAAYTPERVARSALDNPRSCIATVPIHEAWIMDIESILLMSIDAWRSWRDVPWSGIEYSDSESILGHYYRSIKRADGTTYYRQTPWNESSKVNGDEI